jgi:hypothetical protein
VPGRLWPGSGRGVEGSGTGDVGWGSGTLTDGSGVTVGVGTPIPAFALPAAPATTTAHAVETAATTARGARMTNSFATGSP